MSDFSVLIPPPIQPAAVDPAPLRGDFEERLTRLELERAELVGMFTGLLKGMRVVQWLLGGALIVGFSAATFFGAMVLDAAKTTELNRAAILAHVPAHAHEGTRVDVTDIRERVAKLEARDRVARSFD